MASVVKTKTGYCIQLSPKEDAKRPKIHLGRIKTSDAHTARGNIVKLINLRNTGGEMTSATSEWLNGVPGKKKGISDGLRARLETLGLVERSKPAEVKDDDRWSVTQWVDHFIKTSTKPDSDNRRKISNVGERLKAFFGNDKIEDITDFQCKNFRAFLKDTIKLSENTTRRHIGICRQIFNAAIDNRILSQNPFKGQAVTVQPNPSRFFYVGVDLAQKVLEAMPDAEWRLIFGLARWGGLRCPSEVVALKWSDVDFEKEEFIVHSPKTAHHVGHDQRTVPMFPELKPLFLAAQEAAPVGSVYCVNRYRDGKEVNLRTQFDKFLSRAKIFVWQKPFQNCRSTRESELFRITNGNIKAVCSWIGNSEEIALKHYAQLQEADLKEAARKSVLADGKVEVHNQVHDTPEKGCTEVHGQNSETPENSRNYQELQGVAGGCTEMQKRQEWAEVDSNNPYYSANNADFAGSGVLNEVLDYYCPELEGGGL